MTNVLKSLPPAKKKPAVKKPTVAVATVKRPKFNNVRTTVDGLTFDSKGEAARWTDLRRLEKAGQITGLSRQTRFALRVNGKLVCTYVGDFSYYEGGKHVVEDFKSPATITPIFRLKAKLMQACHGITVRITQ